MNTETVQVKYVNPPKQEGWDGSIKTEDGRYIGVKPEKLGLFQPGKTYTILVAEKHKGDKTYFNFAGFPPQGQAATQQAAPQPQRAASNGYAKPPTDDATPERIYVCGVVNAAISSAQVAPSTASLVALTNAARAAWAQTFGGKAQGGHGDEPPPHESDMPF